MDFSESRTYANLMTAFAGESQARNKYTFYAKQAEDGGYRQISDIYKETAENERAHAEIWFRLLHGDGMPSVYDGLLDAADGEWFEFSDMYKKFAADADDEGYKQIAGLFRLVGNIEKEHHDRFKRLAKNIKEGIVFKRDGIKLWMCQNCGNIHAAESAPEKCPVCGVPQAYFEIKADNY